MDSNENKKTQVTVIGAGLAGCEAALQLASRGISVTLYEMRPEKNTSAHSTGLLAELVCSNSLRSTEVTRASGLLKAEIELLGSHLLEIAKETSVPAGTSLSVDRWRFAEKVTECVEQHQNIILRRQEVKKIPKERPLVVATGPLTSLPFFESLKNFFEEKEHLYFYDAVAPLVYRESIDLTVAFEAARYGKGEGGYLNCPMDEEQYYRFYRELINAERYESKVKLEKRFFEACLPVEELALRGKQTLLFGPLKPVGLIDPRRGKQPFAVVQLRQDDAAKFLYNMVGFQTNLKYGEQERVFKLIPGLEKAEFARYGKMHLNTFIKSPKLLNSDLSAKKDEKLFFCGQITGTEGYVEAIATGLLAGLNAYYRLKSKKTVILPPTTALGSLVKYITNQDLKDFQPMHASFGLLPPLEKKQGRRKRYISYAKRSLKDLELFMSEKSY